MKTGRPTPPSIPGSEPRYRLVLLATVMATMLWIGLLCFFSHGTMAPALLNDSYQYLSVAQNLFVGHGGMTSLVHFDAERSFGVLPAPMVSFPLGYPLLLALTAKLGLSLLQGAFLLNAGATIVVLWLYAMAALRLRLPTGLIIAGLGALAVNACLTRFTAMALSEPIFTLLSTAGVLLLVLPPSGGEEGDGARAPGWLRPLVAGLLIGLAYHVRYAGLFFLVGLAVLAGASLVHGDRRRAKHAIWAAAVAAAIMAVGLARNTLLVGNWRGGNGKIVTNALLGVLETTVRSFDDLLLGIRTALPLTLLHGLFVALALLYLVNHRRQPGASACIKGRNSVRTVGMELSLLVCTYCACMFYAGLTTMISYTTRMFVPILPLLFLAISCFLAHWHVPTRRKTMATLLAPCLGLLYLGTNVGAMATTPSEDRTEAIRALLQQPDEHGVAAAEVVFKITGPTGTILANDGQAMGHILNTKTLSLITQNFSTTEWTEPQVRDLAQRSAASAVVLLRPQPGQPMDPDLVPSAFVGELTKLRHPPWLVPVFQSPRVVVYSLQLGDAPVQP